MKSIFDIAPGLSEKMDSLLKRYDEYHIKTYGNKQKPENSEKTVLQKMDENKKIK